MKTAELRKKDTKELKKLVADLTKKLSDLRFAFASSRPKNVKETSNIRKDIARILTITRENSK